MIAGATGRHATTADGVEIAYAVVGTGPLAVHAGRQLMRFLDDSVSGWRRSGGGG